MPIRNQSQLRDCDENSLCWLYCALTFNNHFAQNTRLSAQFTLMRPQGASEKHVQQILDAVYVNTDLIPLYLKGIQEMMSPQRMAILNNTCEVYLRTKINALNNDAKKWLFWLLTTLTEQPSVTLREDAHKNVAIILFMISHNVSLFNTAKSLLASYPEVLNLHPELDCLSDLALRYNDIGELAYQASLSEEVSLKLVPFLLKHLSAPHQQWLGQGLASGNINSTALMPAYRGYTNQLPSQELRAVPSLIALAIKWLSVEARLSLLVFLKSPPFNPSQIFV